MSAMKSSERALKLMAYADGELEGAERAEVERWIKEDAEAVLFANDLAELGDLVKAGHKASADAKAVASFDLADAIMAKVASEEKPKTEAKVVSLSDARARKASPHAAPPLRSRRGTAAWIAAGLALAASVFLVTRNKEEAPMARTTTPLVQPSPSANANTNPAPSTNDVDVENPGYSVSVFYLPNENSVTNVTTSVVVWVDETGGK